MRKGKLKPYDILVIQKQNQHRNTFVKTDRSDALRKKGYSVKEKFVCSDDDGKDNDEY